MLLVFSVINKFPAQVRCFSQFISLKEQLEPHVCTSLHAVHKPEIQFQAMVGSLNKLKV